MLFGQSPVRSRIAAFIEEKIQAAEDWYESELAKMEKEHGEALTALFAAYSKKKDQALDAAVEQITDKVGKE